MSQERIGPPATACVPEAEPPAISVIITCHNLGRYLAEAVDSVLAQTFQDFEILIVDDGSTDRETQQVLASFTRPRTTVYATPNRGVPAARNFLIRRARGEYLCALDADDVLHPSYFEKGVALLEADPGLTFVSCWLEAFGEESWIWKQERCDLVALLAEDTVIGPALVRREAVTTLGGYDEAMKEGDEDWDLSLRLASAGHRGTIFPEVLLYYRRRAGSLSTRCERAETHLAHWDYLLRKHRPAYRANLREVLLWKERDIGALVGTNSRIERRIESALRPAVKRCEAELTALQRRLEEARTQAGRAAKPAVDAAAVATLQARLEQEEAQLAALREEYRRAREEVAALRRSWSWRMTAPLRAVYALLRGLAGTR